MNVSFCLPNPGFSVKLLCFVQANPLCRYGCMYFFAALVLVYVDVMVDVICVGHDLTGALGDSKSAV